MRIVGGVLFLFSRHCCETNTQWNGWRYILEVAIDAAAGHIREGRLFNLWAQMARSLGVIHGLLFEMA